MMKFERFGKPGQTVRHIETGGQCTIDVVDFNGNSVARKMLLPIYVDKAEHVERIHREIDILTDLRHPNLVPVVGSGEYKFFEGGKSAPYYLMPLAESTLKKKGLELDWGTEDGSNRLVNYFWQLLLGVSYCHVREVVHRDIKPANVLIINDEARVADFGLGKRPNESSDLTVTGRAWGTDSFMAPEQRGAEYFQNAATQMDVYSLGAVLYWLISGKVYDPFAGHVDRIVESIPDPMLEVLKKSVQLKPSDRFENAMEFRDSFVRAAWEVWDDDPTWIIWAERPVSSVEAYLLAFDYGDIPVFQYVKNMYQYCVSQGRGNIYDYFTEGLIVKAVASEYVADFVEMVKMFDESIFQKSLSWSVLKPVGEFYGILIRQLLLRRQSHGSDRVSNPSRVEEFVSDLAVSYLRKVGEFADWDGGRRFVKFFANFGDDAELFASICERVPESAEFIANDVRREWITVDREIDQVIRSYEK